MATEGRRGRLVSAAALPLALVAAPGFAMEMHCTTTSLDGDRELEIEVVAHCPEGGNAEGVTIGGVKTSSGPKTYVVADQAALWAECEQVYPGFAKRSSREMTEKRSRTVTVNGACPGEVETGWTAWVYYYLACIGDDGGGGWAEVHAPAASDTGPPDTGPLETPLTGFSLNLSQIVASSYGISVGDDGVEGVAVLSRGRRHAFELGAGVYDGPSAAYDRVFIDVSYVRYFEREPAEPAGPTPEGTIEGGWSVLRPARAGIHLGLGGLWSIYSKAPANRVRYESLTAHLGVSVEFDLPANLYLRVAPRMRWFDSAGADTVFDTAVGVGYRF